MKRHWKRTTAMVVAAVTVVLALASGRALADAEDRFHGGSRDGWDVAVFTPPGAAAIRARFMGGSRDGSDMGIVLGLEIPRAKGTVIMIR